MDHESLWPQIPVVLRAWGFDTVERIVAVPVGTLNWNFDVRADGGRFFLRCHRPNLETERISGEHLLLDWVFARGIPVAVPIRTVGGQSLVQQGGLRWSLYPWMDGTVAERGRLSTSQACALGEMHGRIQAALADHPESQGAALGLRWGKEQSLEMLGQLVVLCRQRDVEGWITDAIERQLSLLEALPVLPPEHFSALPCQLLHGDFHDQQVLFAGDRVSAVVDWEISHNDPRAWELIRSLAFSGLLESPRLEDYMAGYRKHVQLAEDEVQLALTLWFQSRVVGLWAWWTYLVDGNDRLRAFFPAMVAELDQVTDERWTSSIRSRLVSAACW